MCRRNRMKNQERCQQLRFGYCSLNRTLPNRLECLQKRKTYFGRLGTVTRFSCFFSSLGSKNHWPSERLFIWIQINQVFLFLKPVCLTRFWGVQTANDSFKKKVYVDLDSQRCLLIQFQNTFETSWHFGIRLFFMSFMSIAIQFTQIVIFKLVKGPYGVCAPKDAPAHISFKSNWCTCLCD